MKAEIHIVNGPNLNVLGDRPPIYGEKEMAEFLAALAEEWSGRAMIRTFHSNHGGDLIDYIQWVARRKGALGMVINPGGLTHTSVALADALEVLRIPVVEVHLTNIYARAPYRRHSYVSPHASVVIGGAGFDAYRWAVEWIWRRAAGASPE